MERKTYRESLQNNREQILLSKQLATIDTTVPVEFELEDLATHEPDLAELKKIYKELEFYSLLKEVGPTEDSHTRDYTTIADARRGRGVSPRAWPSWIPRSRSRSPSQSALEGDLPLTMLGVSYQPGVARALSIDFLDVAEADSRRSGSRQRSRTT